MQYYEAAKKLRKKHKAYSTEQFTSLVTKASPAAQAPMKQFEALAKDNLLTHERNRTVLTIGNGLCRPPELGESRSDLARRLLAAINKEIVPDRDQTSISSCVPIPCILLVLPGEFLFN